MEIDWNAIDKKWQKRWSENNEHETDSNNKEKKFVTVAYPYPNSPQHIGHGRTYTIADVHSRYLRMKGFNVLFPMGFHYTGTPILGMAKRVEANDAELIEGFKTLYNVPEDKIKEFVEPVKIADYFHEEIKSGMIEMGYSIDWRREFTTIDPAYQKFIEWQFRNLKEKNLIVQGSHPVGWCPKDQNPVSQHDTLGDVEPDFTEYIVIKFDLNGVKIPVATLRPETLFGVTNIWINPQVMYQKIKVNDEIWITSPECARKLEFLEKKIEVIEDVLGSDFVGQSAKAPHSSDSVLILPASFVKSDNGTGIVMSVPAHAPFDYQALLDSKSGKNKSINSDLLKNIQNIEPISMINTEGLGNIPAKDIVEKMGILHQDDPKLEEATKEIYSKEFYEGILGDNTKQFAGKKISEAKDEIKEWITKIGSADILLELTNSPVKCRCGTECVVKLLSNQWFLDYSNKDWKQKAHSCFEGMNILPNEIRSEFDKVLDWLRERACARQHGLGTKVPWDKEWLVESLADSVIYMAFYIISKYVNKKEINGNDLTDEFFDYVFYGKKNSGEIANKINITKEKLEEIRNEFLYFYPVDSRHSGRDLVPNHLTFFVLNHVALFPEENWPQEIVVNGSVLMAGKKMSKSMGNIIPLRDAVRKHGADPIRLTILISAELLQDADFNVEAINGIKNKLESMYENSTKTKAEEIPELEPEDKWILSMLQNLALNVSQSMDKIRFREALHHILYDFDSELQWYLKRTKSKQRTNISGILHKILSSRVLMLSPFAPHIAEEIWKKLGNSELASKSAWPSSIGIEIDSKSIQTETLLKSIIDDINNILRVTKISPKKITIYTAEQWKSKAYNSILKNVLDGQTNIGTIIKSLIANKETEQIKKDPDFVKKTLKDILSEPVELRNGRMNIGQIDEKEIISSELSSLVKNDYDVELGVFSESDSEKYDPKNKAKAARPFKPAILIE
ncbi:leucine--tRNA ligase [Marine Group I thaumarchaeote]|uniref:Leucine--tRNA ligase n=1 Tax=Marine Group I thaumarchaeote TaxID=2511932 RepID=A0A7K4NU12_9ARCH|nr:leucine--tRNA ligase [Marine Group I thaumarchaeote]